MRDWHLTDVRTSSVAYRDEDKNVVWAFQHPNKSILADMILTKRMDAITGLVTRLQRYDYSWRYLYMKGFRAVKVHITADLLLSYPPT